MSRKLNLAISLVLLAVWSTHVLAAQNKALSEHDLLELLGGGVYTARIVKLIHDHGICFAPTTQDLDSLRRAGADPSILEAVETAQHPQKPPESARQYTPQFHKRIDKHQLVRQTASAKSSRIDGQADVTKSCRPGHLYSSDNIVGDPQSCIKGGISCCGSRSSVMSGVTVAW
jgi:hypothetical protein